MPSYDTIENPYNNFLERGIAATGAVGSSVGGGVVDPVNNLNQEPGHGVNNPADITPGTVGGESFDNLWIRTWIKSQNYLPKSRGFLIDGEKGYIEAANMYLTGSLVAAAGTIGGFEIGADYIRDAANTMGLASTVTSGDDIRGWAGASFANRATAPFRYTEAGAVTASNFTHTGGSVGGATVTDVGYVGTTTADDVPTSLVVSSTGISTGSDGSQSAYVVLTWDAIATNTFDHYLIRYKKAALTYYTFIPATTNTITIEGLTPNISYNFGVASINKFGTSSAFSADISQTTATDGVAPATVTSVSATGGIQYVIVEWTHNTDSDLASYNVYRNTVDDSATATLIGNSRTNYFVNGGLTGGQIYYFWIKATDTSGNVSSSFSTVTSATPRNVENTDVTAIASDKILIDGVVYLSNWRHGSDVTKIDGGNIYTGSVTTTQLNFTPVQSTDVIASINASVEGITIDADNITISGATTFASGYDPTDYVASLAGSYNSAASGARVRIFPDANTGLQIIDDASNDVFKAMVGGTDVGDVIIGNYAGSSGLKWDKSTGIFDVLGKITTGANSNINAGYVTAEYTAAETIVANDWVYLVRAYTHDDEIASQATYVHEQLPDDAYDTADGLNVSPIIGGPVGEYRTYIQFDITSLPSELDRAILRLRCTNLGGTIEVSIKEVTASWSESGLTWNTKPTQNEVRYDVVSISASSAFYDFDITELYKKWKSGNNYGLAVCINSGSNFATFASEDHATTAYRPRLIIVSNSGNNVGKIGIAKADSTYSDISSRVTIPGLKSETVMGVALTGGNLDDTIRVIKIGKYTDTGSFTAGRYYYLDTTGGLSTSFSGAYNNRKVAYGISTNEAEIKIGEHYRALTAKRWADDFKVAGSGSERGVVSDVHVKGGGWGTTADSGLQRIYVGFKPRKIRIQALNSNNLTASDCMSIGTLSLGGVAFQNSQNNYQITGAANGTLVYTHSLATFNNGWVGILSSVDDIGFYIDWTAAGTVASTSVLMVIECWG